MQVHVVVCVFLSEYAASLKFLLLTIFLYMTNLNLDHVILYDVALLCFPSNGGSYS